MLVDVIMPALDEADCVAAMVRAVARPPVRDVIVVDNGSSDGTGYLAEEAGARVVFEPRRGYGAACQAGVQALAEDTEVVVFLDADGSDDPALIPQVIEPIVNGEADLVVGSRARATGDAAGLSLQDQVSNTVATHWLRYRFGLAATDLGSFRAIRRDCLRALKLIDRSNGWTVEMQIKAARRGLRYAEVPMPARSRMAGHPAATTVVRGAVGAAVKVVGLLAWHDLVRPRLD